MLQPVGSPTLWGWTVPPNHTQATSANLRLWELPAAKRDKDPALVAALLPPAPGPPSQRPHFQTRQAGVCPAMPQEILCNSCPTGKPRACLARVVFTGGLRTAAAPMLLRQLRAEQDQQLVPALRKVGSRLAAHPRSVHQPSRQRPQLREKHRCFTGPDMPRWSQLSPKGSSDVSI